MKKLKERTPLLFYLCIGAAWALVVTVNNVFNNIDVRVVHFIQELWLSIYLLLVNFILFEYCLPLISKRRKSIFYTILLSLVIGVIYLFLLSLGFNGWDKLGVWLNIYPQLVVYNLIPYDAYHILLLESEVIARKGISSVVFFAIAKLLYGNFKLKQTARQLRFERQEAELNYLRTQTNPHFLFNTLNNIYSLARDKSDLTPGSVLRLSQILRFMLYEASVDYIRIEQEIQIIEDYIALERLRYKDSLDLDFKKDLDDPNQSIPPLLMIPLVENAFKHGISETTGKRFVDIYLSVKNNQLLFRIRNSSEKSDDPIVKENIGIGNLKRQLGLLYKDYNFTIERDDFFFTANLKINLLSHV